MADRPAKNWRWFRCAVQLLCLVVVLILFRQTEYRGSDEISQYVNMLFRLDPLVALAAMLGGKQLITLVLPALIVVIATVFFGRFFCGWMCPMGTILDGFGKLINRKKRENEKLRKLKSLKYIILIVVLVAAVGGLPLVGLFDPFSILVRAMAVDIDPAVRIGTDATFDYINANGGESVKAVAEPTYDYLRDYLLPFDRAVFSIAGISVVILIIIIALENIEKRFWCRNLCPLGALLAVLGRFGILYRHPGKACRGCMSCQTDCRMGAIDDKGIIAMEECTLCMDCLDDCPHSIVKFNFTKPKVAPVPVSPSRRTFLAATATGLALPLISRAGSSDRSLPKHLIRPPGAAEKDADFLDLCVRCGECMKVCPNHALQPILLDAGVDGLFSPCMAPRIGYCEYNCTLCGQVCPTGAIPNLAEPVKHKAVMGKAVFDPGRCLPYEEDEDCICCEEHCPIDDKAIRVVEVEVVNAAGEKVMLHQPYVVEDLCVGCGICEHVCPLDGDAAIRVVRTDIAPAEQKRLEDEAGRKVQSPPANGKSATESPAKSSPY